MSNAAEIDRALRVFVLPGQVVSIQALYGSSKARSFCTSDLSQASQAAQDYDRTNPLGVYFTLNPVDGSLNRTAAFPKNDHIVKRCWLPIDVDPFHPSGTSASDAEKAAAWQVLTACRNLLDGAGLRGAVVGDSGNGWHLCYPIDCLNDKVSQELLHDLLQALDIRCSDSLDEQEKSALKTRQFLKRPKAYVDQSCHDARRIWKLYGTTARKGEPTPERPHRQARLLEGEPWQQTVAAHNTSRLPEVLRVLLETFEDLDQFGLGYKASAQQTSAERAYCAKGLSEECQRVAAAVVGTRNDQLCKSSFAVGQLIGSGRLSYEEAFNGIYQAALQAGCDNPRKDKGTIARGLRDGMKQPRDLTQLNGHVKQPLPTASQNGTTAVSEAEWEEPIPLNATPPVEQFPLHVLPEALRTFAEKLAWATSAPPDFVAVPMLVCAASAIGNSRHLSVTRTHRQPPCLFAAVIGRPGSGKSTPLDLVKEPLEQAERKYHQNWQMAVAAWNALDSESRPPKPVLRRTLLDDTTVEAMVRVLNENPRGVCMARDELAALVTGMNQYKDGGKGSDRQAWLKIWSGATIKVDRKSQEGIPLTVRRPLVGITGGIQPQVIECLRGEQQGDRPPPDDGFLDRFLLSYPDPLPAVGETWRDVSEAEASAWTCCLERLLHLTGVEREGDTLPQLIPLNDSGRIAWTSLTQEHADQVNAGDFPDWLRGPWAKLVPGYAGRLALVLELLWHDSTSVSGESVKRAFCLIRYFKSHTRKVYATMGADPRVQNATLVLNWLTRHPDINLFSRRDAYKDLCRSFKCPEALDAPLTLLTEHRYLYQMLPAPRKSAGRKQTNQYQVNPLMRHKIDKIDKTT